MKCTQVAARLAVAIALTTGVLFAQDQADKPAGTEQFKCPDGTAVDLNPKYSRPFRCPDTDSQRQANEDAKANEEATRASDAKRKKDFDAKVAESDKKMALSALELQRKMQSNAAAETARKKREAAALARMVPVCRSVHDSTIDKKISDLTVRETEQVSSCRRLGLY
jgi:hypothetical protein